MTTCAGCGGPCPQMRFYCAPCELELDVRLRAIEAKAEEVDARLASIEGKAGADE